MAHKFKILTRYSEGAEWFLHSKYPISYKLVLIHCFYAAIKNKKIDTKQFKEIISETLNYIKTLPLASYSCNFYSLYRFYDHQSIAGVFCVDHTHTCFPLVFYNKNNIPHESRALRVAALEICIADILKNSDEIFKNIMETKEWDEQLQGSILKLIPEK